MVRVTTRTGVLICGHGSRDPDAIVEFDALARQLRETLPAEPVGWGYLEFAQPVLNTALDGLRAQGVREVFAVPGMLFAAGHAKNDIPSVLNTYQARHPDMRIHYGRELGITPKLLHAASARIGQALAHAQRDVPRHETLLMVVGRGASDPDANGNVAKLMRMLWEGMGFGWGETAYSGVTFPLVAPALEHAARLGYRRIIVFPYFLFTGILVRRIYDHADQVAARFPEVEVLKAPYLKDHPLVLEAFLERIGELREGPPAMNCQLCKYRAQILGFEAEVGLAQASHHHHVEGAGVGPAAPAPAAETGHHHHQGHHHHHGHDHGYDHDRGHDHDHDHQPPHHGHPHPHDHHHHHPYPHADHPHGPVSLKRMLQR